MKKGLVVPLVFLVLMSGCIGSGIFGSSSSSDSPNGDKEVEEQVYPPGLSKDKVKDIDRFLEYNFERLRNTSYTYEKVEKYRINESGKVAFTRSTRTGVSEGSTSLYSKLWNNGSHPEYDIEKLHAEVWKGPRDEYDYLYIRISEGEKPSYDYQRRKNKRPEELRLNVRRFNGFETLREAFSNVDEKDISISKASSGIWLSVTTEDSDFSSLMVFVGRDGYIRQAYYETNGANYRRSTDLHLSVSMKYSKIGGTKVSEPGWYEEALNASYDGF